MNAQLLIQAVIQQTTVFLAQLATAGGLRTPLGQVSGRVFADLSRELSNQGVSKNVIADMFGLTLRTYHRRVRELSESSSVAGETVWEAVLQFIRANQPASASEIFGRFARDEREVVSGVLSDLVAGGFCYRTGRGHSAVYRVAAPSDMIKGSAEEREAAVLYLVWQSTYQNGPLTLTELLAQCGLPEDEVVRALNILCTDGRAQETNGEAEVRYSSPRIDVPVGQSAGWEAAVFDHFQAMVSAVCAKLAHRENRSESTDWTGGATISLDLWPGHPFEEEALGSLARVRNSLLELRAKIDAHNALAADKPSERLTVYVGQHFKTDRKVSPRE